MGLAAALRDAEATDEQAELAAAAAMGEAKEKRLKLAAELAEKQRLLTQVRVCRGVEGGMCRGVEGGRRHIWGLVFVRALWFSSGGHTMECRTSEGGPHVSVEVWSCGSYGRSSPPSAGGQAVQLLAMCMLCSTLSLPALPPTPYPAQLEASLVEVQAEEKALDRGMKKVGGCSGIPGRVVMGARG